jgi:hypothetical protein
MTTLTYKGITRTVDTGCKDCKKETLDAHTKDYYMVTDALWSKFGVGKEFLCMDCIEHRMGHKIRKEDLSDCFLNSELNPYTKTILEDK